MRQEHSVDVAALRRDADEADREANESQDPTSRHVAVSVHPADLHNLLDAYDELAALQAEVRGFLDGVNPDRWEQLRRINGRPPSPAMARALRRGEES